MIVARICDDRGKPIVASGSCKIDRYDGTDDGWFPIDDFNFGFLDKPQDADGAAAGAGGGAHAAGGKPGGGAHAPAGGQPGKGGKAAAKDFSEVTFKKNIDTASNSLMVLAMRERKHKKGVGPDKEKALSADFHILASVSLDKQQADRFLYTSLMIHLEAVNVLAWDINASGDARPTETVKLRYDRAAMIYVATPDGKHFQVVGPNGWDQTKNDVFEWNDGRVKQFYPPNS